MSADVISSCQMRLSHDFGQEAIRAIGLHGRGVFRARYQQ